MPESQDFFAGNPVLFSDNNGRAGPILDNEGTILGEHFPVDDGIVRVKFLEPQSAIAPGQAVVFYSGDVVIGGETIKEWR